MKPCGPCSLFADRVPIIRCSRLRGTGRSIRPELTSGCRNDRNMALTKLSRNTVLGGVNWVVFRSSAAAVWPSFWSLRGFSIQVAQPARPLGLFGWLLGFGSESSHRPHRSILSLWCHGSEEGPSDTCPARRRVFSCSSLDGGPGGSRALRSEVTEHPEQAKHQLHQKNSMRSLMIGDVNWAPARLFMTIQTHPNYSLVTIVCSFEGLPQPYFAESTGLQSTAVSTFGHQAGSA